MGLDMYLSKRTYVKNWSFQKDEEKFNIAVKKGNDTFEKIKPERISYITEEIMYWRKANQIHGWFVSNCEPIREDIEYLVTTTDLEVLLEACKKVLEIIETAPTKVIQVESGWDKNGTTYADVKVYDSDLIEDVVKEILPPTEGFFFGGYEIGEYYKETIEDTINMIEEELSDVGEFEEYRYYASW